MTYRDRVESSAQTTRLVGAGGWERRPLSAAETAARLPSVGRGVRQNDLEAALRGAILEGIVPNGSDLPSPETVSRLTGVAPLRYAAVLARLRGEALITGAERPQSAGPLADDAEPARSSADLARIAPVEDAREILDAIDGKPDSLSGLLFAPGEAPLDIFPVEQWARLYNRQCRVLGPGALRAGHPAGYAPLRMAIAAELARRMGEPIAWSRILIQPSRQHALTLALRLAADIGTHILCEEPCDPAHRAAVLGAKARIVPVPMDDAGLLVHLSPELSPTATTLLLSYGPQFPTTKRLSPTRRRAIDELASERGWLVIEDDCGGSLFLERPSDEPPPGLLRNGVLIGSFGRAVAPGLGLAFLVPPEPLVETFVAAARIAGEPASTLMQATFAEFIETGAFADHLVRTRAETSERHRAFLGALDAPRGSALRLHADETAALATIQLRDREAELRACAAARDAGFGILSLSPFYTGSDRLHGVVVGYANAPVNRIELEARRFWHAVRGDAQLRHRHEAMC